MPAAEDIASFDQEELDRLFAPFLDHRAVVLAVSGGPDSTALALLAKQWRTVHPRGPKLFIATVDHGLRASSVEEAKAVKRLSRRLRLPHETLVWSGEKPGSGIQEAARLARYALLADHARAKGASAIAVAHTLDDQAETVLFRLARGSGLAGLSAMRQVSHLDGLALLRPFLDIPKARLIAVAEAERVPFARDPSNVDPRFTRPRLRALAPTLAAEGLDARRLALFARRAARADAALEAAARRAEAQCLLERSEAGVRLDARAWAAEPEEIALRVLLGALAPYATEGQPELAKAERLSAAMMAAAAEGCRLSRTLAGAMVVLAGNEIRIHSAPRRREKAGSSQQIHPESDSRPWQGKARHLD